MARGFAAHPGNINRNGRPEGSGQKAKLYIELKKFVEGKDGIERFIKVMASLPDADFVKKFGDLLEFFISKKARTESIQMDDPPKIEIVWNETKTYAADEKQDSGTDILAG